MGAAGYIPTVLSFCSGYAGIERGLDLAGVEHRVLAYVEIEAFAIANLVKKMEDGELAPAPIYTDLKTFPSHLFRGAIDIITGGYPCQPFSAAGKREGENDPRHLWPFISHHIDVINPDRVFFENVEGHISLGLSTVLSDLEDRGFDTTWGIFSAAEVGAAHPRVRTYIMADRGSQGLEGYPRYGDDSEKPRWLTPEAFRPASPCDIPPGESHQWSDEPGILRVVDGCTDYVDRIRLLGNGVVPQTAAKAWQVLNSELSVAID